MLFTGEYEYSIDAQQRLAIPSDIRARMKAAEMGDGLYFAPGMNEAVWLWPEATFERLSAALSESMLPDDDMLDFEELFFSQTTLVRMDKAGRVRIPDRMLSLGKLDQNVVILGIKDHLELREPTAWNAQRQTRLEQQRETMARARRALSMQTPRDAAS